MFLIGMLFASSSAKAEFVSTATYLNLPFGNVLMVGDTERNLHFHDVNISSELMKVMVNLDAVETALTDPDASGMVTTLDVIDAKSDMLFDWLGATKVVIRVRLNEDLNAWNRFLNKEKLERERSRKLLLRPRRVLPPKN